ncbi:MAG: PASTA domain-containing protein [Armatimonadetes bacterium]|nr:PASTA domain-containing protein [Armatimonadota bacterium]
MIGSLLRIRYEVVQELEDSSIFKAFRVRDRVGGREVKVRMVKAPFGQEKEFTDRLAEVIGEGQRFQHPNLERLLELDDHEGTPFLVSELPPGTQLKEKVAKLAPFSAPVTIQTAIGICEALVPMHEMGVAHGDISTANVFVTQEGRVKVAFAGMWRAYGSSQTAAVMVLPSMAPYLAPEVTQGGMPSPTSDIYGIGIVMYELLSGKYPFSADTPVAMAMKHATAPVPSLRLSHPGVPVVLEEIIKKCLAKLPQDRYPTAQALVADLRILQDALRFGKQVSWPIKPLGPMPEPVPVMPAEPQLVAPRMSAIQKDRVPQPEPEDDEIDYSDRFPRWVLAIGYVAILAVVVMVGVYFAYNLTKPKLVALPNLVGRNAVEATQDLEKLHVKLRTRDQQSEKASGTILKMDPEAGQKVRENSSVIAWVSAGSENVEVPDLRGDTLDDAKQILRGLDLKISSKIIKKKSSDFEEGVVIGQNLAAGQKIPRKSEIRLTVSSGKRQPENVDDSVPRKLYTITVGPLDLPGSTNVRVELLDDRYPDGFTIYEQRHVSGETLTAKEVGYGELVRFKIFYDGVLVDTVTQYANEQEPGDPAEENPTP